MKELGVNCVRVFVLYGSLYLDPGVLRPEGIAKFDEFLGSPKSSGSMSTPPVQTFGKVLRIGNP